MLVEHQGKRPRIHPTAYIAPTAVLCGDVTIGAESRVLFGAVLTAEGGPVKIGRACIVMEYAVIRGSARHPARLADHVLVGPHAHLTGCSVDADVFIATGASIFNGAQVGSRSTVRIHGIVHVLTSLPEDTVVPIGWVAVGTPPDIVPPTEHARISARLNELNFPKTVFGLERAPHGQTIMPAMTARYGKGLAHHREDRILDTALRARRETGAHADPTL